MAVLFVMFRRLTPSGLPARLDFSYWEILGLLGWAYLLVSTLYLLFAKRFKILLVRVCGDGGAQRAVHNGLAEVESTRGPASLESL